MLFSVKAPNNSPSIPTMNLGKNRNVLAKVSKRMYVNLKWFHDTSLYYVLRWNVRVDGSDNAKFGTKSA